MATAKKKTVVSKAISTAARKKVPKKKIAAKVVKKAASTPKRIAKKSIPKKTAIVKKVKQKPSAVSVKKKKVSDSAKTNAVAVIQKLRLKSSDYQEMVENWDDAERKREELIRGWARRLVETKSKMLQVNEQYKKLMLGFLQEAYAVYVEIENSEHADDFYAEVRWKLKTEQIKIQSNTPNAGLVIRFVCGAEIATKTISDYSRVMEGAKRNEINPSTFVDWG
jgi:flagellar biosynthesis GTPase FlhF